MTYIDRAGVFASNDIPTADLEIPEWGGTIKVRGLPGGNREWVDYWTKPAAGDISRYIAQQRGRDYSENKLIREAIAWYEQFTMHPLEAQKRQTVGTVIICALNEDGSRMFTWDDAERLRNDANWDVIIRIANFAAELMTVEGSVDEGKDSSETTPDGATSTD